LRLPANIYRYGRRGLVRCQPSLVRAAKDSCGGFQNCGSGVDYQQFILMAGTEIYLLAGLLGLGVGYLLASKRRLPQPGQFTKVYQYGGRTQAGGWEGIDPHTGLIHVGGREYDPDDLQMVGPIRKLENGQPFVDLKSGFVNPDELAKLKKAHNRNGFHRRKGGS
jgi:hypothetical protein